MTTTTQTRRASLAEAIRWRVSQDTRSRATIARMVGISYSALGHWCNGTREPDTDSQAVLEEVLGLRPFTLMGDAKKLFSQSGK